MTVTPREFRHLLFAVTHQDMTVRQLRNLMFEVAEQDAPITKGEISWHTNERGHHFMNTTTCPRCGENRMRADIVNALSRKDNETYICSSCGTDEAMNDWHGVDVWPSHPDPMRDMSEKAGR